MTEVFNLPSDQSLEAPELYEAEQELDLTHRKIADMHDSGWKQYQIAEELNLHFNTVHRTLKRPEVMRYRDLKGRIQHQRTTNYYVPKALEALGECLESNDTKTRLSAASILPKYLPKDYFGSSSSEGGNDENVKNITNNQINLVQLIREKAERQIEHESKEKS